MITLTTVAVLVTMAGLYIRGRPTGSGLSHVVTVFGTACLMSAVLWAAFLALWIIFIRWALW